MRLDPRPHRRAWRDGLAGDDVPQGDRHGSVAVAVDGQRLRAPRRAHAEDVGRGAVGEPVAYDDPLAHDVRPEAVPDPGIAHGAGF